MTQPRKRKAPQTCSKRFYWGIDASPEAIIEMRGVVKKFSNAAGEFTVLKGVDLMINKGEFVFIVGKSGSGKSTLLNMITGIDHPSGWAGHRQP